MRFLFRMGLFAMAILPLGAPGMTLGSRGTGQVLLYPYYTVNRQQQTIFTVTNTTSNGKVLYVWIREGENGRALLGFSVFLAPHDFWSGTLFSLEDAGISGSGAGIVITDSSCTEPSFATLSTKLADGRPYQPLLDFTFTGANADTGPTDDSRTREGTIEIFEMGELSGQTLTAITPTWGTAPTCDALPSPVPSSDLTAPGGGLVGSSATVYAAQGTFFSVDAYAIDGFFNQVAFFPLGSLSPNLSDANVNSSGFVTADIPVNGSFVALNYLPEQAIDAVSALFMADTIYGDWDISAPGGANTDWVMTFPTKRFYVDPLINMTGVALPPFETLFGDPSAARSDAHIDYTTYGRDGVAASYGPIGFTPTPTQVYAGPLPYSTQVATFTPVTSTAVTSSNVLGSNIVVPFPATNSWNSGVVAGSAVVGLNAATQSHQLRPTADGIIVQGLPVIGFSAVNYIDANITPGVLSNYNGTYPLRSSLSCSDFSTGVLPAACN